MIQLRRPLIPGSPLIAGLALACFALAAAGDRASSGEFTVEESPSPGDEARLYAVASDPESGRLAAVGSTRTYQVGGSPFYPLVMIKDAPGDTWTVLDPPDFGLTWHDLRAVAFLPGTGGDFVAVGEYYPDPDFGYAHGMFLRFHRASGTWDLRPFSAPGYQFHFIRDIAVDPDEPGRVLIAGTKGRADAGGNCFVFDTMVIDYRVDALSYTDMPTNTRGGLSSIAPLGGGRFLGVGISAGVCDYIDLPVVLEIGAGFAEAHPIPPPHTPDHLYRLNAITALRDGRVFMLGMETPDGGSAFATLGYRYDPVARIYEPFPPFDPDPDTSQLWDLAEGADGTIVAVGRYHTLYQGGHYHMALIESFDGSAWTWHQPPEPLLDGWYAELWGMTLRPDGQAYTVGLAYEPGNFEDRTLVIKNDAPASAGEAQLPTAGPALRIEGPNPFAGGTSLSLDLPRAGGVHLRIHDARGALVRRLLDQTMPTGTHRIDWDGRDDRGRLAPPGAYFARLAGARPREAGLKLLLVR